jgi:hypothetical protein
VADVSELVGLRVRPGYEHYGATAYFDANAKPVRIRWSMYVAALCLKMVAA